MQNSQSRSLREDPPRESGRGGEDISMSVIYSLLLWWSYWLFVILTHRTYMTYRTLVDSCVGAIVREGRSLYSVSQH